MAPLKLSNPRDLAAWRRDGVHFSTTSDEAAKLFDRLMYQVFALTEDPDVGGMEGTFGRLMEADPKFVLIRVLRMLEGHDCLGWRERQALEEEAASFVRELEASPVATDLERRHARAAECFVTGRYQKACDHWLDVLNLYPKDLLAARQIFDYGITSGDSLRMRSAMTAIHPYYKPGDPYYAFMLSRLAFSLEERGDFTRARNMTDTALAAEPKDAWAAHTMAHILEGSGAGKESARFLLSTVAEWRDAAPLACHNFWHTALGHIELGAFDDALQVYDTEILPRTLKSNAIFPLSDAASLLFRLQMEGRAVPAESWRALAEVARSNKTNERRIMGYYDGVVALCFAHVASDPQASPELSDSFRELMEDVTSFSSGSSDMAVMHREIGLGVICAAQKFVAGDFSAAADLLFGRRFDLVRLGGSNSQRDVFDQMLCRSLMNSDRELDRRRCQALLQQRSLALGREGVTGRMLSALTEQT